MLIRQAVLNDYKKIALVHYYSYMKAGEGILPESELKSLKLADFEQRWKDRFNNDLLLTLVAVEKGEIVGFTTVDLNIQDNHLPMLRFLYIHEDHWRQGIGSALIKELSKKLIEKNFTSFFAWTLAASPDAQSFYSFLQGKKDEPIEKRLPLGSQPNTPGSFLTNCIRCTVDNLDRLIKKLDKKEESVTFFSQSKQASLPKMENLNPFTL